MLLWKSKEGFTHWTMLPLIIQAFTAIIITLILFIVSIIINFKSHNNRNKESTFECGFDPYESSRLPFSLRFFLLAIIFLIFDIEIALLFPLIVALKISNLKIVYITRSVFLLILTIGLFHEWNQGTIRWVICVGFI